MVKESCWKNKRKGFDANSKSGGSKPRKTKRKEEIVAEEQRGKKKDLKENCDSKQSNQKGRGSEGVNVGKLTESGNPFLDNLIWGGDCQMGGTKGIQTNSEQSVIKKSPLATLTYIVDHSVEEKKRKKKTPRVTK